MKKRGIILILILVTMIGANGATAQNATLAGTKFYDYDQDGVLDGHDFGLQGWTIFLTYLNGTAVPGASTVTGPGGNYSINLTAEDDYYVNEVLKPGWTNTTNATVRVELVSCGDAGDEFFTNASSLNVFMPNLPDGQSYVLLGWNSRIGDSVTELPPENEGQIFYPLGQWNSGQSSSPLSTVLEVDYPNNTYVPFDAGWTPGVTLYQTASWNINGASTTQTSTHPRPNAVHIEDILIRLHSEDADFFVEVNNLTLTQGPYSYTLVNQHMIFNQTGSGPTTQEDLYLLVHASDILEGLGGTDISEGFNLTGDIRYIFPTTGHAVPTGNEIKMDIMVGRYLCPNPEFEIVDFGNYIDGNISGYKLDAGGNGLSGWNISAYEYTVDIAFSNITNASGYYRLDHVPFGTYYLNETLQDGWMVLTGNRTVVVNATNLVLTNQNFTNTLLNGNLSGYKLDPADNGLPNWTISVYYQNGTLFGTNITNESGYFIFDPVPFGNYTLTETLKEGYIQTAPPEGFWTVNMTEGTLVNTSLNFTNQLLTGNFSGYKLDPLDNGLPGWTINVYYENGTLFGSQVTGGDGSYLFDPVPFGNYTVTETLKEGYMQLAPPGGFWTVNMTDGTLVNTSLNFTNALLNGNLSGYKLDPADNGLAGWTINVYYENGTLFGSQVTGGDGSYLFDPVPFGNYTVTEVLQTGYTQIAPPGGFWTVNMTDSTLVNTSLNFTNSHVPGNLSGYKLDPSDNGLSGWTINVYYENGTLFGSQVTGGDGSYLFDPVPFGNYTVTEVLQTGYTQIAPPEGFWTVNMTEETLVNTSLNFTNQLLTGNISGYKLDLDEDGLSGWNISVYYENGTLFGSQDTGLDGSYSFDPVPFGNYTVWETLQDGWMQIDPPDGYWPVNMTDATLIFNGLNFTNEEIAPFGNISGYKLDTLNHGLSGWNISLYYENGTLFGSQDTLGNGSYTFDPVPLGNYTVWETLQNGWVQTAPPGGFWTVNITDDEQVFVGLNFTNYQLFGNISGYKLNTTDAGLSGWTINVYYENGTLFGSQITGGDGSYLFDPVLFGNYTVTEVLQSGWTRISPVSGYYLVNMTDELLVFDGRNFTNLEPPKNGNISGIKFNDLNGDGLKDVNDLPLSGWVINLFYQNGTLFATEVTDSNGQFVFDPVPQGLYNLTEVLKDNWTQTAPPSGYYLIEVNGTALNFTLNFGNQEIPNPCSCPTNAFFTWARTTPAHSIKFTDASTGNPTSWMWSFGDGKFSNVRNPKHTYSKAGTYKVMLSVASCDCAGNTYYTYYSKSIKVT